MFRNKAINMLTLNQVGLSWQINNGFSFICSLNKLHFHCVFTVAKHSGLFVFQGQQEAQISCQPPRLSITLHPGVGLKPPRCAKHLYLGVPPSPVLVSASAALAAGRADEEDGGLGASES